MINPEIAERIKILECQYEKNWGQSVDYTIVPRGMTQKKLAVVLEITVKTGDSILVGYEKVKNLIAKALEIRKNAYAPYSDFYVGAVVLTESGKVYTGTNIENSSYPVGLCAERTAFSKAISEGERKFELLVIVGGKSDENSDKLENYCSPCGMCRQFISEFCTANFTIILAKSTGDYKVYTMSELLPLAFDVNNLK